LEIFYVKLAKKNNTQIGIEKYYKKITKYVIVLLIKIKLE